MEPGQEQRAAALPDVETITNLDTARMTLRWALERLQKLEREGQAASARADAEEKTKLRALTELGSSQKALALRTVQELERARYYQKLEEFLTLSLGGQLDLAALAKRDLESKRLLEILEAKRTGLEREYAARAETLEADWRRRSAELEAEARTRELDSDRAHDSRRASLEAEAVSKAVEQRDREAALSAGERSLEERRRRFDDHAAAERARLNQELKNLRDEVSSEISLRAEMSERLASERQASLEESWDRERALLLKELASWRAKAQQLAPRLIEHERDLDVAEEAVRRAKSAADRQTLILADYQQAWESEKAGLEEEAARWKEKSREHLAKVLDLGRRLAQAEEALQQTRAAAEQQISLLEEQRKSLQETQDRVIAELRESRRREAEAQRRGLEPGK